MEQLKLGLFNGIYEMKLVSQETQLKDNVDSKVRSQPT